MRHQLTAFTVDDLVTCAQSLRTVADGARSLDGVADVVVEHLFASLVDGDVPACALARFYVTVPFARLRPEMQAFAVDVEPDVTERTPCLTLLATRGLVDDWNHRSRSQGHQAIPLTSTAMVDQSPMIAKLMTDLGLDVAQVVEPDPAVALLKHHQDYGVFHVAEARGSAAIPAQDFVERYGIESVVGFGGSLPSGTIYAVVLFTTVPVSARVADLFRTLSLTVKALVVPFTYKVFAD